MWSAALGSMETRTSTALMVTMLAQAEINASASKVRIKEGIEVGNGLPTLVHYSEIVKDLEKSGFEIIDSYDANRGVHALNEIPWYDTLNGKMSLSGFRMTHIGRMCTHTMVFCLETLGIAPAGTTEVSAMTAGFNLTHQVSALFDNCCLEL